MTISALLGTSPAPNLLSCPVRPLPGWQWPRSELAGGDRPSRSWPSTQSSIVLAPLAAVPIAVPRLLRLPAAVTGSAVLAVLIVGVWRHPGLFFPALAALAALAAGARMLWRARSWAPAGTPGVRAEAHAG